MMNNKQRYRCKSCGCFFTEGDARIKYNDNDRFLAITSFRKGLSLCSIAEIIGTNNLSVLNWLRNIGMHIKDAVLSKPVEISESLDVIEIDEMWHYVQKTKKIMDMACLLSCQKAHHCSRIGFSWRQTT